MSLLQALEIELNQTGVAIFSDASDCIEALGLCHMSLLQALEIERPACESAEA